MKCIDAWSMNTSFENCPQIFPFCGVNANTKSRNKDVDDVWSRWPYCHSVDKTSLTCDCHFKLQICDSQLLTGDHNLEGLITIWTHRSWLWTCKLWLQLKTLHLASLKIIAVLRLNCKLQCEGQGSDWPDLHFMSLKSSCLFEGMNHQQSSKGP